MLSLSMVVIAALVGADGLGVPTLRALNQVNIARGFEVGVAIVLVAIILDRLLQAAGEDKRSRARRLAAAKARGPLHRRLAQHLVRRRARTAPAAGHPTP